MLEITIPEQHYKIFDEKEEIFLPPVNINETTIQLEHSLISLKKWEQKWHKPFLSRNDKTNEEIIDYIKCMTLTPKVNPIIYNYIPKDIMKMIELYINDPMTATTIKEDNIVTAQRNTREGITAEIIYYWMISLNIPVEFQKWHLSQLLTLIKVVSIKNDTKPKKVDKNAIIRNNAKLNEERRRQFNSKG